MSPNNALCCPLMRGVNGSKGHFAVIASRAATRQSPSEENILIQISPYQWEIASFRLMPWIPKALAMLVGQALACMQKMQEHFSVAMT
jgi:hypothetical protein